jgi:large subunit ribosomal protein L25
VKPFQNVLGCAEVVIRNDTDAPGPHPCPGFRLHHRRRAPGTRAGTSSPTGSPRVKRREFVPAHGQLDDIVTFGNDDASTSRASSGRGEVLVDFPRAGLSNLPFQLRLPRFPGAQGERIHENSAHTQSRDARPDRPQRLAPPSQGKPHSRDPLREALGPGEALHRGPGVHEAAQVVAGRSLLIELNREDKAEKALSFLQEIQRDPITDRYLHVDLHEVKPDEKFEIRVPVRVVGESFGVKNQSGVLEIASHVLRIRCLPEGPPEAIEIDVTALNVGQTIKVGELKPVEGVTFLDDKGQPVVACVEPVAEIVQEVAAAAVPAEGAAAAPAAGDAAAPAADGKAAPQGTRRPPAPSPRLPPPAGSPPPRPPAPRPPPAPSPPPRQEVAFRPATRSPAVL